MSGERFNNDPDGLNGLNSLDEQCQHSNAVKSYIGHCGSSVLLLRFSLSIYPSFTIDREHGSRSPETKEALCINGSCIFSLSQS